MNSFEFLFDGAVTEARLEREGGDFHVTVGDTNLRLHPAGRNLYDVLVNGRRMLVAAVRHKDKFYIDIDSVLLEVREATEENVAGAAGDHAVDPDKIFAPMPGKIVKILVEVGQTVAEKQQMVIVEAMKMENPVLARASGTVKAINYRDGEQVGTEAPIIELELAKKGE